MPYKSNGDVLELTARVSHHSSSPFAMIVIDEIFARVLVQPTKLDPERISTHDQRSTWQDPTSIYYMLARDGTSPEMGLHRWSPPAQENHY